MFVMRAAANDGGGGAATTTDPPAATDPPATDPPATDPPAAGDDDTRIGELVEAKVRELLGDGPDDGNRGEHGDPVTPPATSTSSETTEQIAARTVRAELDKLKGEQEHEDRLKRVEQAVEKPPIKQNRLSKLLWGKAE